MKKKTADDTKEKVILETLRRELLNGVYPANSKLPIHTELSRRFRAGGGTVQRAMQQLIREGFLQARRRHGTFVAGNPPHLKNYALVFHSEPAHASWSKYYVALMNAAVEIQREGGYRMLFFYGVDGHVDTEDYQRLLSYIRAHRLAGIIFDNAPHGLQDTPLVDETGIPRIAFMSLPAVGDVLAIAFNHHVFTEKSLDYLASRGRQRLAIICGPGMDVADEQHLNAALSARGLSSPSHWRIPISAMASAAATKCMQLLMQGAPSQRPDALMVTDDNLVEHSLAGLVAAGIRVPQDLDVVVHCNFPCPPVTVLPVKRLGYDIRQALQVAIDLINRKRLGKSCPGLTRIQPVFEEELAVPLPKLAGVVQNHDLAPAEGRTPSS